MGVPTRLLVRNVLLYLLAVPLMLFGLFLPWEAFFRSLSFAGGVSLVGLGIYVAHGAAKKRVRGG